MDSMPEEEPVLLRTMSARPRTAMCQPLPQRADAMSVQWSWHIATYYHIVSADELHAHSDRCTWAAAEGEGLVSGRLLHSFLQSV